jgi:2-amino-4-hydroxy-6-hydroxymethyldihydropteridine diphosphokinase
MGGRTALRAFALLERIHQIESALGRDRGRERRRGPRPLDIDIILYGDLVVSTPTLTIPHPGVRERAFVLVPLLELAPETRDPLRGDCYRDALEAVRGQVIAAVDVQLI